MSAFDTVGDSSTLSYQRLSSCADFDGKYCGSTACNVFAIVSGFLGGFGLRVVSEVDAAIESVGEFRL